MIFSLHNNIDLLPYTFTVFIKNIYLNTMRFISNSQFKHPFPVIFQNANDEQKSFEDRLVSLCQKFMAGSWTRHEDVSPMLTTTCSDLTLLHLAAALGFSRLACTLLHWRNENSSLMLEREVDAMSRDKRGCTPLVSESLLETAAKRNKHNFYYIYKKSS